MSFNNIVSRHIGSVILTMTIMILPMPLKAQDNRKIPKYYIGTWAKRCESLNDPVIKIDANHVIIESHGNRYVYSGVDFSYTYGEGAHASGRNSWILVSRVPNGLYAFVLTVPGFGKTGAIVFGEGAEGEGSEVRDLSGAKFRRCGR